jgi:hypothetical protein
VLSASRSQVATITPGATTIGGGELLLPGEIALGR